jgi:hypothetical protein
VSPNSAGGTPALPLQNKKAAFVSEGEGAKAQPKTIPSGSQETMKSF